MERSGERGPRQTVDNRCKGVCFHAYRDLTLRHHGETGFEQVLGGLSSDLRTQLSYGGIVKGGWYPLAWYLELHATCRQRLGLGLSWPRQIGRESTLEDLSSGVLQLLVKVLSPESLIRQGGSVFNRYYERGTLRVDSPQPGRAVCRFEGCVGFDENLWQDVLGGIEGAMVSCQVRNLRIHTAEGARSGDANALFELFWSK